MNRERGRRRKPRRTATRAKRQKEKRSRRAGLFLPRRGGEREGGAGKAARCSCRPPGGTNKEEVSFPSGWGKEPGPRESQAGWEGERSVRACQLGAAGRKRRARRRAYGLARQARPPLSRRGGRTSGRAGCNEPRFLREEAEAAGGGVRTAPLVLALDRWPSAPACEKKKKNIHLREGREVFLGGGGSHLPSLERSGSQPLRFLFLNWPSGLRHGVPGHF